jgi:hypothetical protein
MSRLKVNEIVNVTENGAPVAIEGFSIASGKKFKILGSRTIGSDRATGESGEICWDTNYLYICVATNTWKRIPLTW